MSGSWGEAAEAQRRQKIEEALQGLEQMFGSSPQSCATTSTSAPQRRRKRTVRSTTQLSTLQRNILAFLVDAELEMKKDERKAVRLRNVGIPWGPSALAQQLNSSPVSLVRALGSLEKRQLVYCVSEGEGRGRRYRHIKLTEAARRIGIRQKLFRGRVR